MSVPTNLGPDSKSIKWFHNKRRISSENSQHYFPTLAEILLTFTPTPFFIQTEAQVSSYNHVFTFNAVKFLTDLLPSNTNKPSVISQLHIRSFSSHQLHTMHSTDGSMSLLSTFVSWELLGSFPWTCPEPILGLRWRIHVNYVAFLSRMWDAGVL